MKREVFDDLWDKADKEHSSQGNNSFTFKHHLFAVLDDELKEQQQPQLTIPKSIADELDGYFKYKNPFEAILRDYSVRSNDVIEELRDYLDFLHSNLELCIAYLAGKALGVDLVKVGEG